MVELDKGGSLPALEALNISGKTPDIGVDKVSKKKDKQSTRNPKDPSELTPEYVAEQRELRRIRKEEKQKKSIAQPKPSQFIKRKMLNIPGNEKSEGRLGLKIMTYNVLAQALIKRDIFPTNGKALKWTWRSQTLLDEISYYDCDIMCLQEVDGGSFKNFWKPEFGKLGYECKFYQSASKSHGVCIVVRKEYFTFKHQFTIRYDEEVVANSIFARTTTDNIGLLTFFEFSPQLLKKYPYLAQKNGIILGTTHLYWHPCGCFERTRQTYLLLQSCHEFTQMLTTLLQNDLGFYRFFAGDMNTEPFDYPYLSITAKPVVYEGKSMDDLKKSIYYLDARANGERRDDDSQFICSPEQVDQLRSLQQAHNNLEMRAISLYSVGYDSVHPDNSGVNNKRGEPVFSNWANSWRGLLDYIFIVADWNKKDDFSEHADTIEQVEINHKVKLLGLLRMPTYEEMGAEPSGQPRVGQYPSDHLTMIAKLELH